MDVQYRCGALKDRVAVELQEAIDTQERCEILIAALYELSRKVLPELGRPGKSREYLEDQNAVLELVSFIAIPLIRNSAQDSSGVAVLTEIAQGCLDPLLQKKLSVYAQQLLAQAQLGVRRQDQLWRRRIPWLLAVAAAAVLALFLAQPWLLQTKKTAAPPPEASLTGSATIPLSYQATVTQPLAAGPAPGTPLDRAEKATELSLLPAALPRGGGAPGELTTVIRVANNQVLVPVLLKNDGETVQVELVLDTGATRTTIHEGFAGRLRIDLRQSKLTESEVADGRIIRSHSASVESLSVGPYTMDSSELDFIPYKGSEGMHDGLLGMDFLGKHRYQIDMEHELIRWF